MNAGGDKDRANLSPKRPWLTHYPRNVNWLLDIPVRPLYALIDDTLESFSESPFLDFFGRRYTYAQASRAIAKTAAGLQTLGVGNGTRVGLFLPNCPYSVICYYAILKAGGTVVNFDPLSAERELIRQIEDSETEILITLDLIALIRAATTALPETGLRHIVVCKLARELTFLRSVLFNVMHWREISQPPRDKAYVVFEELIDNDGAYQSAEITPREDLAVIQYTGGTTGEPKGVMLSHHNVYANACQTRAWFTRAEPGRERLLAIVPFSHSFGMTAVMNLAVSLGSELVIFSRFNLKQMLKAIGRKRITMLVGVPALFQAINQCTELHRYDLSSLKVSISGGDSLPISVQRKFVELTGCPLAEGYGLTECSPVVTCSNPLEGRERPGSCGVPLPQTTVEIVSVEKPDVVLPPGELGEICVSGPQIMLGYWRQAEATRNCLIDGRFHTGDVGRMDNDGFLYFVDRLKDVISTYGYKVYPSIVEDAIRQHPAIVDAAVIGVSDPKRGQLVKAYLVLAKEAQLREGELEGFLADKLSPVEIPRLIESGADLPKSTIGKVLKRAVSHHAEKVDRDRKVRLGRST
jgi:long-chain acyl-CoA synthetase